MSEEIKKSIEEDDEQETIDPDEESLEATGQIILGEIEKIGGILTANSNAQAQGEYNIAAGRLRQEIAEGLAESDSEEE